MPYMVNVWLDAFGSVYPQWEAAVRHTGSRAALVAASHALAGMLFCARALATGRNDSARTEWFVAAGVLALLGANALLRVDLLAISVLRTAARADGWYAQRRDWQLAALGALTAGGAFALWRVRARLRPAWSRRTAVVLGLGILTGTALLRAISHHATDLALDARLFNVAVGRLLDAVGLILATTGAMHLPRAA